MDAPAWKLYSLTHTSHTVSVSTSKLTLLYEYRSSTVKRRTDVIMAGWIGGVGRDAAAGGGQGRLCARGRDRFDVSRTEIHHSESAKTGTRAMLACLLGARHW